MRPAAQIRPSGALLLMGCVLVQALSGIGGGTALVLDPNGGILGMPIDILASSQFADFLVPGLVLLLVLGLAPLLVLPGLWMGQYWGWIGALLVGFALVVWILVQVSVIGYSSRPPLQLIYGLLGVGIVILTLLPSVRNHYGALTARRDVL